jgi:predicted PurR-regulated permease PerM
MTESNVAPPVDWKRFASMLVALIALVVILVYSQEYVIPFIIALIIWFIIHELRENIQQVPFLRKYCPMWLQSTIGFLIIVGVLVGVVELLIISVEDLAANVEEYQVNFEIAMFQLSSIIGLDVMGEIMEASANVDFSGMVTASLDVASGFLGDAFLILIYVLFLLIEEAIFPKKMQALYGDEKKIKKSTKLFQKMDKNISRYLSLKTIVSLMTGVLSYFVLLAFGLDGAIFWAFLIFLLNYIPTIGSLIATLFPSVFAILQFGDFTTFIWILILVSIVQVLIGNVVEPKMMGNSLNISSLVVILSLTIWGAIWGIMGMILSVPITVMMIIVFEEIPNLRPIAIMLSEQGNLNFDTEEEEEIIPASA